MLLTTSITTREHLRRILRLGVVATLALLLGALGVMAYWVSAVDVTTARQEEALVTRTLERRKALLIEDVTSSAIWDDAWIRTAVNYDPEWAEVNFGQYYFDYMGHDRTVLLDRADRPIYAARAGKTTSATAEAPFAQALAPLLAEVRAAERDLRRPGRAPAAHFAGAVTRSRIVVSEGATWLVGASTVTPENTGLKTGYGPAPVVVSARQVNAAFMQGLEQDLGIHAPRLIPATAVTPGGKASTPLLAADGRPLGRLAWEPARPGVSVMMRVAPFCLGALAVILLAGVALGLGVRRALKAMVHNDDALHRTLEDLTVARDRAEAASVAKSQFLANMSHEIRTPLNGVLGMAQIMADGSLEPGQRQRLQIIQESGASLLAILNDVLDLAKIEAGKLEIVRADTALEPAIQTICDPFAAAARAKGLAFGLLVEDDAQGKWRLDGLRLGQILANLLSNAVKFTQAGHIAVRVWRDGEGLAFCVMDTGAGIPADRIDELFGKFNQLDASTTRQHGGTGLGLAISRELATLMDGSLEVESTVGRGCLFTLRLPAEAAAERLAA